MCMPPPRTACRTYSQALASPCRLPLHFTLPDTLSGSPLPIPACLLGPLSVFDNPPSSCHLPPKFLSSTLIMLTGHFRSFGHPQTELK